MTITSERPTDEKKQSAEPTVADAIVRRLVAWGARRIYGYSGDGINPLLDALRRDGSLEFVQARHEENAALIAVGEAKYEGGVGLVISTQGPGAIHLLNGLYDAKLDHTPIVAILGQQHRSVLGSGYMQEVNLRSAFADVASSYLVEVTDPAQLPSAIDRAFRNALATSSPAVVIVPHDVQRLPEPEHTHDHGDVVTAVAFEPGRMVAERAQLESIAALFEESDRPALLVGRGAAGARVEVAELADRIGAAIVTSLLGKPFVDESLPLAVGTMGHLGTTSSARVLAECDALLIIGSNDPWTEFYPQPGQVRAAQVDIDARVIGNRYPIEVGVVADAASALRELIGLVAPQPRTEWRHQITRHVSAWHSACIDRAGLEMSGVNPEAAIRALQAALPEDCRIALDVGSTVYWYARQLRVPEGAQVELSGTLATMGGGVPYGLGAKLSAPDRPTLVLTGDGGMQMTGLAELVTVASRWQSWADPRFVIAVLDNGDLAEVTWEQREMESAPRFDASQSLPPVPYADYARLLGLEGRVVETDAELEDAWTWAFALDRPCVLQFRTDPAAPLLPPQSDSVAAMREALTAEREAGGPQAERASELLEAYVRTQEPPS
jgi:pyruvate dehydrogenase (quinone)